MGKLPSPKTPSPRDSDPQCSTPIQDRSDLRLDAGIPLVAALDLLQNMIAAMLDLRLDPLGRAGALPLHQAAMLPMQLALVVAVLLDLIPRPAGAGLLVMFAAAHGEDAGGGAARAAGVGVGVGAGAGVVGGHDVADLLVVVGGVEDLEDVVQVTVLGRQFLVVFAEAVPEAQGDVDVADDAVGQLAVFAQAVGLCPLHVCVAGEDGQGYGAVVFVDEVFEPQDGEGRGLVEGHADILAELDDEAGAVAFAHSDPDFALLPARPGAVVVRGHFAFADGCAELEAEASDGGGEVVRCDGASDFEGAPVPSEEFFWGLELYGSEDHRYANSTIADATDDGVGVVDLGAFREDVC